MIEFKNQRLYLNLFLKSIYQVWYKNIPEMRFYNGMGILEEFSNLSMLNYFKLI